MGESLPLLRFGVPPSPIANGSDECLHLEITMSRPKPISKMARSTMRVGGAPRGPKVQSNKSTTVGAVHELLSAPYNDENRSRINYQLVQLRPKGGGRYRGRLLTRTADGAPTIDNDAGEIIAAFGVGKSNGIAYSGEGSAGLQVQRKDIVVLEHLQIIKPASLQDAQSPGTDYQQHVDRAAAPRKLTKAVPQETPEQKAERIAKEDAAIRERREFAYRLVERVQNALNVDGFTVTNHAVHWRDVKRDPLSDILRDGLSFTFEGVEYNLEISPIDPKPGQKAKR